MAIRTNTKGEKPDFSEMLNEVDHEIETHEVEQSIVDRLPELRKLSEDIEKATNTFLNATLQLESAIQMYKRTEEKLNEKVSVVRGKIDTINTHLDHVLDEAPNKLTVTVKLTDENWKAIKDMSNNQMKALEQKMLNHYREMNQMLTDERQKTERRYRESEGIYFGSRMQWVFLLFFYIGIFIVATVVLTIIIKVCGWL